MRVVAASDHAGYELRTLLIRLVEQLGHTVSDLGTRGSAPVDYPDSSRRSAERYEQTDRLILICGSSVEASVAANKISGIRGTIGSAMTVEDDQARR